MAGARPPFRAISLRRRLDLDGSAAFGAATATLAGCDAAATAPAAACSSCRRGSSAHAHRRRQGAAARHAAARRGGRASRASVPFEDPGAHARRSGDRWERTGGAGADGSQGPCSAADVGAEDRSILALQPALPFRAGARASRAAQGWSRCRRRGRRAGRRMGGG